MKFEIPASAFAFAWQAVWPAAATRAVAPPFFRSVIIERYDHPDVCHMWATDGALLLRALAVGDGQTFTPEMWEQVRDTRPAETVFAHDAFGHGVVLAKTVAQLAKDDESLKVQISIGRKVPSSDRPALSADLEPLQAVVESDGLRVELVTFDMESPDWRMIEPSIDLGARVKQIGFVTHRLKRLSAIPGTTEMRMTFTSSTGAAVIDFPTPGGGLLPVRGLLMPTREEVSGTASSGDVLAAEFEAFLAEHGELGDEEGGQS